MKTLPPDIDLATRKLLLQQRSAVLRELLAVQLAQTVAPVIHTAERVQTGSKWIKRHPVWIAAAVMGLLVWRPRGALKWAGKAWTLWQTWQRMEPVVSKWMSAMQTPGQDGESSPAQPPAKEG